jgi:FAD/FMN-containing dehydrogenase
LGGKKNKNLGVVIDNRQIVYHKKNTAGFNNILNSIKLTTDPNGIMNPGVLIDPEGKQVNNWMTSK